MAFGIAFTSSWYQKFSVIFRYTQPVPILSMKKKGPYVYIGLLTQNNIHLWTVLHMHGDSHFSISMRCVYSLPHISKMCLHRQRLLVPEVCRSMCDVTLQYKMCDLSLHVFIVVVDHMNTFWVSVLRIVSMFWRKVLLIFRLTSFVQVDTEVIHRKNFCQLYKQEEFKHQKL